MDYLSTTIYTTVILHMEAEFVSFGRKFVFVQQQNYLKKTQTFAIKHHQTWTQKLQ